MPKMSRNLNNQKNNRKKCGFLRFLVIVLSFISLISRVIYCTFATWLTITTFDCIPCPHSITATNTSSDLFIAHHSSAVFKTVRALNVDSALNSRPKRSQDLNDSTKLDDNYSEFFTEEDNSQNQTISKSSENVSIELKDQYIEDLLSKSLKIIDFLRDNSVNKTDPKSAFFGEESLHSESADSFADPVFKASNETSFDWFTYIPGEDLLNFVKNVTNSTNSETNVFENTTNSVNNTMIIDLEANPSNSSNFDPKARVKSLRQVNDTDFHMTKTLMNVCSEDCTVFLGIELSDPDVRKWATIVITGVLYFYAIVMLCVFLSTCMALVDLLVLSTFIEGAKLFAGFILIIIDSFNGLSYFASNY